MNIVAAILALCVIALLFFRDLATPGELVAVWFVTGLSGGSLVVLVLKEILSLFHKDTTGGTPASHYHPEAGVGVETIALNSQPLPSVIPSDIGGTHSNGWSWNRSKRRWESDKGGYWGYFDDNGIFHTMTMKK